MTESITDRGACVQGILYRAARIREVPVIIRARSITADEIEFVVDTAEDLPLPPRELLAAALKRKFSLNLDLPSFYQFVHRIPELSHLPDHQAGLRPILKDSLFESLCLAIIDQQLTVSFAARLKQRLMQSYGRSYQTNGLELWLFPTLNDFDRLPPDALRILQFSRNKSSYVIDLARRFRAEPAWEQIQGTDDEIVDRLCSLRGIGRWTAEYGAMMGLGRVDTIPAADIGLMRMVQRTYHLPARPSEAQVRSIGQCWSPWRGLVTFYLWHQEDTQQ